MTRCYDVAPPLLCLTLFFLVFSLPVVRADERSDPLSMGYRGLIAIFIGLVILGIAFKGKGPLATLLRRKSQR